MINIYEIIELRKRGLTLREIENKVGIPREKINQIIKKHLTSM